MNEAMSSGQAALYVLKAVGGFYILLVMLRFLLQLVYADFYNPICQFVVKATQPILGPMRRIVKPQGRLDFASLLLAYVLQVLLIMLMLSLLMSSSMIGSLLSNILLWAAISLGFMVVKIFYFSLIVSVILSWVAPMSQHPAALLINQITEPMLMPIRKLLPSLGGLDISPIFALIALNLLDGYLLANLAQASGMPAVFSVF